MIKNVQSYILIAFIFILSACGTSNDIPEGSYLLHKVKIESDSKEVTPSLLTPYVRQQPKSQLLSLLRFPTSKKPSTTKEEARFDRLKERHVLYDSVQTNITINDMQKMLRNMGYLRAEVDTRTKIHKKHIDITYQLHPGSPFYIKSVHYNIPDSLISRILKTEPTLSKSPSIIGSLQGKQFSVEELNNERDRITSLLQSKGYYKFHKDYIEYEADTIDGNQIDLIMNLLPYRNENGKIAALHPCYKIKGINYTNIDGSPIPLRDKVLQNNTSIAVGQPFNHEDLQKTYNRFAKLSAVQYSNIKFNELPDTLLLDCNVLLQMNKAHLLSIQPEGTNTAGDLGAAMTLSYENRNLFHGSEHLTLQVRGAYEAIKGLEGYQNDKYEEYGIEAKLQIPRFLSPFLSKSFKRKSNATSEISVSYNLQNRPEFHRRYFTGSWRYRWSEPHHFTRYRLDLIDLNYIYMPWISSTFKHDYLDNASNRNAILRYNYENLLIMKVGFGIAYNNGVEAIKGNIETAGNLLQLSSSMLRLKHDDQRRHTIFNTAYAQYLKFDFDYTKLFSFDKQSNLAMHIGFGIAWPYGNSKVLPFEKRYFAGGPNSVRGWSVRELGPGAFMGKDRRIDFINQTGDMKLDINIEYRTWLFWKFDGAAFIDAGNIWTLRNYEEQPGGQFKFETFYKQIAMSYGLGLRLNFSYFILRLDGGMKAINPAYTTGREHFTLFRPNLKRDFTFHFAVGLPF